MKKRGLSTIISVVLLIVIVLAAIMLIWFVIIPYFNQQGEVVDAKEQIFSEEIGITKIDGDLKPGGTISLTLERGNTKEILIDTTEITIIPPSLDLIIALDLSDSMRPHCLVYKDYYQTMYIDNDILGPCVCNSLKDFVGLKATCENTYSPPYTQSQNACLDALCKDDTSIDGEWEDKFNAAKTASEKLINDLLNDPAGDDTDHKIGLVGYATTVLYTFQLSSESGDLTNEITYWNLGIRTNICLAITESMELLEGSNSPRLPFILLVSDGDPTVDCDGTVNPVSALSSAIDKATEANTSGITVHTVGFGKGVNSIALTQIANAGGGEYFSAANIDELSQTYGKVINQIINKYTSIEKTDHIRIVFYNDKGESAVVTRPSSDLPQKPFERKTITGIQVPLDNIVKIEIYIAIKTASGQIVISDFPQDVINVKTS